MTERDERRAALRATATDDSGHCDSSDYNADVLAELDASERDESDLTMAIVLLLRVQHSGLIVENVCDIERFLDNIERSDSDE